MSQSPTDAKALRELCEPFGGIVSVVIHRPANIPHARQRNFGFVTYNHSYEADACVPHLCLRPSKVLARVLSAQYAVANHINRIKGWHWHWHRAISTVVETPSPALVSSWTFPVSGFSRLSTWKASPSCALTP